MSASVETREAASGMRGGARRAPSCGARTRTGGSCLGLAMVNGRCRIHGGASTGPRTQAGLARMVAAKTTHGRFAISGAPQRLAQRFVWTFMVRARLTAEATMLREYLPAGMAARLDSTPEELMPPKHPSQVAFEALSPLTPHNCLPLGLGRRARAARARLGPGGGVVDGAAVVLRGRAAERLAMGAETAAQAPWRAAIVAARELRSAVQEARGQMGEVRNDPIGGVAGQTRAVRNDPIRGAVVRARAADAPVDARVDEPAGRRMDQAVGWAPGSPGLGEALAREVEKRRLRAEVALRGNDPIRGPVAGVGAAGGARVALAVTGLGSTRRVALGSTTLARTWELSVTEVLAARFGPAVGAGWARVPGVPPGIAAMPSGGCAQRPYTRSGGVGRAVGWNRWGDEGGHSGAARSSLTLVAARLDLSREERARSRRGDTLRFDRIVVC